MTTPVPASEAHNAEPSEPGAAPIRHGLVPRLSAEAVGSFFLVVAGLGVPLFTIPQSSPLPAALAAGLAVTAVMLAFGYVSGGHFNPAVTLGHAVAGRIRLGDAAAYLGAQLAGALLGALALFAILRTLPSIQDTRTAFDTVTAGFGEHSIIQAPMAALLLLEVIGAAILVSVFLGTTARHNLNKAAAPFAVGLTVAVLLQLGQSVGNAPFNPARATASAIFSSTWSLEQLWVFWVAPLVGAAIAGLVFRGFADSATAAPASPGTGQTAGADEEVDDDGLETDDDFGGTADAADATEAPDSGSYAAGTVRRPAGPAAVAAPERPNTDDEAQAFFDGKGTRH